MMAKLTAIAVWFDDGTRYDIEPDRIKSIFTTQAPAAKCGHHGPYQTPGPNSPVKGPFPDPGPPHASGGSDPDTASTTASATTLSGEGSCYYINGVLVCP
jgi:hypothetical protein